MKNMKNAIFWDVSACSSVNRRFGGAYRLVNRWPRSVICSHLLTLVPRWRIYLPWSWRLYLPPKCRLRQKPRDVTSQKTTFFIFTAVKTSNLTRYPEWRFSWSTSVPRLGDDRFLPNTLQFTVHLYNPTDDISSEIVAASLINKPTKRKIKCIFSQSKERIIIQWVGRRQRFDSGASTRHMMKLHISKILNCFPSTFRRRRRKPQQFVYGTVTVKNSGCSRRGWRSCCQVWTLLWFSSVSPGQFRNDASKMRGPISPHFYQEFIRLSFHAVQSWLNKIFVNKYNNYN
jgi:hypothetical protein